MNFLETIGFLCVCIIVLFGSALTASAVSDYVNKKINTRKEKAEEERKAEFNKWLNEAQQKSGT